MCFCLCEEKTHKSFLWRIVYKMYYLIGSMNRVNDLYDIVVDNNTFWKKYVYPIFSSKNILGTKLYMFLSSNKSWILVLISWENNPLVIRLKCFLFTKLIHCSARVVGHIPSATGSKILHQMLFPHTGVNVSILVKYNIHSGSWSRCPGPSAMVAVCPFTPWSPRCSWTKVQRKARKRVC